MTEERKQELRQLLQEAMENLEIRQRSSSHSQSLSMDTHRYRSLLQQYWTSYSESALSIVRNYEPHIVSGGTKLKLLDFIRVEFAPFIDEDEILSASLFLIGGVSDGFPPRFSLDYLLIQLLKITIAYGIEEASSTFDKCTKETQGSFQDIALLEGIKLASEIQVFDGIRLIPLPNSTSELPYYLRNHLHDVPKDFFSGKTLLVVDYSVSPIFHKPFRASTMQEYEDQLNRIFRAEIDSKDFPNLRTDDFPLNLLCQALSLACHSGVKIFFHARFLPGDKLYNLSHGIGGGSWRTRPRIGNFPEVGQHEIEEAKHLYQILVKLNSEIQEKLQIPIDRWLKSKGNKDTIDKIIDLGIALEALYLSEGTREQLTLQFRLRASWHLGKNKKHRKKLIDEFKAIYDLRSQAVHSGEVPKRIKMRKGESLPTSEFITKAQDLCRDSILKILEDGEFPDWNDLILGEFSLDFCVQQEVNLMSIYIGKKEKG